DDVTKAGVARALGLRLMVNEDVLTDLKTRYAHRKDVDEDLLANIATLPERATCYMNPLGAAPGFAVKEGERTIYVLPGVPGEMKVIFERSIARELQHLSLERYSVTRVVTTFGLTESEIARRIGEHLPDDVRIGYLPGLDGVKLRLTAGGSDRQEIGQRLKTVTSKIVEILGDNVVSTEGLPLSEVVGKMLIESHLTIAIAESCTGGLIGHLLTEIPGISSSLDRDVVAYSNATKVEALGVDSNLIETRGAVSGEVAAAMAEGVRARSGTDIGLSTTGIAGPTGGTPTKPVGTVYIGLAFGEETRVEKRQFRGDRSAIKVRAANTALDLLRRSLLSKG
ncbi:MAG TPA: nicotinamide-nucleotide amidohydrolase family protein, partial [Firmicutes bacterium]|nr:nicotinamide-nucleotide amidohydrolase family protein [Bacillota bacterium]